MLADLLLKPPLAFLIRHLYRIDVRGLEHYQAAGDKVLIVANHQSYLDPLVVALLLPERPAFAINVFQADKWYFRWLDKVITLYRLDPSKPLSMKRMIHDLRAGAKVVVFPEGRITTSGGIMKVYDGAGMMVEKTGAAVLPVRIDGADYSKVSRLSRRLRQRWFPKVTMTLLPPVRFAPGQEVSNRDIYDLMTNSAFAAADCRRSLLSATFAACRKHGGAHRVASDTQRMDMNYRQLLTRAFVLREKLHALLITLPVGGRLGGGQSGTAEQVSPHPGPPPMGEGAAHSGDNKYIALLLPNSLAVMVAFVSLHMLGRVPCMLNFSAGEANILHGCRIASAKTVLTSRAFVGQAKLEAVIAALQKECRVIYLEDVRASVTLKEKFIGAWHAEMLCCPIGRLIYRFRPDWNPLDEALAETMPDDPAVVLYTSGSEGTPKGVALSHANILSNLNQVFARLDLMPSDILFNALPVFHSFGLSVGMLMPLVGGLKTFLYPSPLHYRVIPDLVYDTDATIMLGTDTFYNGYARYAHAYDFWNIRLAVAGAEKLREKTRLLYAERFHLPILEGYGVTEASPVVAVNTPMEHKAQTVGRLMPGIEYKLEKIEGLEKGGRLRIKGPNIMLGYLKADQPGVIQPQDEWYDTGDIVAIDEDGFIAIHGRAKRFAKIAGEMVSLQAVEDIAAELAEGAHAAIAVPDEKKGEQIVLFTESAELTRDRLIKHLREKGMTELCLPRHIIPLDAMPRLATGKIDYQILLKGILSQGVVLG